MSDWDAWAGLALPMAAAILFFLGGSARHDRVSREGGTIFFGESLMHRGYALVAILARGAARMGVSPAALSWISLLFGAGAGLLAAQFRLGFAAWALAVSGLLDGLDGAVARLAGSASQAGAVLDSALDRYVEFFLYAGLFYSFHPSLFRESVVLLALFGSFMVTYSTAKAEALGVTPPRGWMKRAERLVWLILGACASSAARLLGEPSASVMVFFVGVVAVAANISAIIRLRALMRSVR